MAEKKRVYKHKETVDQKNDKKTGKGSEKQPDPAASQGKKRGDAVELKPKSNAKEVHKVLPLVFGLFAFQLLAVLFVNLLCNAKGQITTASDHWMGGFGYYISRGLRGVFGHTSILLPFLLLNMAILWRRWVVRHVQVWKTILSFLFFLFTDVLQHIVFLAFTGKLSTLSTAKELFDSGCTGFGGGVIGGGIGQLLFGRWELPALGLLILLPLWLAAIFLLWDISPLHIVQTAKLRRELRSDRTPSVSEQEAEEAGYRAKMKKKMKALVPKDGEEPPEEAVTPDPAAKPKKKKDELAPMPIPRLRVDDEDDSLVPPDLPDDIPEEAADAASGEELLDISDPGKANTDDAVDPIFPRMPEGKSSRKGKSSEQFDPVICFPADEPAEEEHKPLPPEVPLEAGNVDPLSIQDLTRDDGDDEDVSDAPASDDFKEPLFRRATLDPLPKLTDDSAVPDAPEEPAEKPYIFPPVSYLHVSEEMSEENEDEIRQTMLDLAQTFRDFKVGVQEINYACGPTVTRYEVTPAPGVRVKAITGLADDIALSLATTGVRMENNIPGKNAVGVEVPNKHRSTVYLRALIESDLFTEGKSKLTAGLGVDIAGNPVVFDIAKMPHLLIAGTTGSGKSVCINCIILSLLYKARPDEVKLVLIDPKKVEFSIYRNIPHLLAPIITTAKDAAGALRAAVEEMERRFELFAEVEVSDIKGYNAITKDDPDRPFVPQIVIIIDELADLMMTAAADVEEAICRIAQKARAAGIHLIVGTQRPSVDVVTGLIKSNIPSRIAFTVSSQVDSRTILDTAGAEKLTGRGDMLFSPIGSMHAARIQGAFVTDEEVRRICDFVRGSNGVANYDENFINKLKELAASCGVKKGQTAPTNGEGDMVGDSDAKYSDAVRIAVEEKKISTSLLQRKLQIGYSRAAKLIDRMQEEGIVSAADGSKPRTILITPEEYLDRFVNVLPPDPPADDE